MNNPQVLRTSGAYKGRISMAQDDKFGIPEILPIHPGFIENVDHAPRRKQILFKK